MRRAQTCCASLPRQAAFTRSGRCPRLLRCQMFATTNTYVRTSVPTYMHCTAQCIPDTAPHILYNVSCQPMPWSLSLTSGCLRGPWVGRLVVRWRRLLTRAPPNTGKKPCCLGQGFEFFPVVWACPIPSSRNKNKNWCLDSQVQQHPNASKQFLLWPTIPIELLDPGTVTGRAMVAEVAFTYQLNYAGSTHPARRTCRRQHET